MEVDTACVEISGELFHFNKGAAFVKFRRNDKEQTCLFRPNKLYLNGIKLGASNFKSVETIRQVLSVGDTIGGLVHPSTDDRTYEVKVDENPCKICPGWYAQHVWKGVKPECFGTNQPRREDHQEVVIENVPGRIILNQLATGTGRGNASQTIISFKNPDGKPDIAMFRNPRHFFMNGKRVEPKAYKSWKKNHEMDVLFCAIYTPGLKEFVVAGGGEIVEGGVMEEEVKFKPNWRARLVWIGTRPSEEDINREINHQIKEEKETKPFLESIQGYEYTIARLEVIVDRHRGILNAKNKLILFHISNLSIDGRDYTEGDDLNSVLKVGENLYCYILNVEPYDVKGYQVSCEVSQIWKGKLNKTSHGEDTTNSDTKDNVKTEHGKKTKPPIPLPLEATHLDMVGKVVSIEAPGLGHLEIVHTNPALNGCRALFSRTRLVINGTKLRFKDILSDYVSVGEELKFDMVRANPEQSKSSYEWMAVLAWTGETPNRQEINSDISKRTENFRAKILILDEGNSACDGGVVQIMGGQSKIGERVLFSRDITYVFGASMARANLTHILKVNDKIQLEMDDLPSPVHKYGIEIKYKASLVWVGPAPKMDENLFEFPHYVGNVITPFLLKRGLSEAEFTAIIKGDGRTKTNGERRLSGGVTSGTPESPVKNPGPVVLPPTTIYGKVVELKKPENPSGGTEHGIFQMENGPYRQEKAFFNRNCLFCWGYNCAKADLMFLINENDRFCVEIQDGTNNKAVPFKVTSAWIGPHPHEKNKKNAAMAGNPLFGKWLKEHNLSHDLFQSVIAGEAGTKPYFPLPAEAQPARLAYFIPSQIPGKSGESDAGVLRLCQNHPNSKDGRKAPEILFERESLYIWNVHITHGDIQYVVNETDKLFVEYTDLLGKEKKKWQNRLATPNVPKFIATLAYIGGGRPKPEKLSEPIFSNSNLSQWLKKRGMDILLFDSLLMGELPPKAGTDPGEDVFSQAYPIGRSKDNSPFNNPAINSHNSAGQAAHSNGASSFPPTPNSHMNSYQASILNKALNLTQRTMSLHSPEDPDVSLLIQDDAEAQLALFLSKTLTNAIMMYRSGGGPGPIGPPGKPGPIGPPRGGGSGRGRGAEFNEFYADTSLSRGGLAGRGEGLYGLSHPLLECNGMQNFHGNSSMEPPYKRKYEDW